MEQHTVGPWVHAGDRVVVSANQGQRDGIVLAVIDKLALIEYVMPKGTSALRIVSNDMYDWVTVHEHGCDTLNYMTQSYSTLSAKWIAAIKAQGFAHELRGCEQGTVDHYGEIGRSSTYASAIGIRGEWWHMEWAFVSDNEALVRVVVQGKVNSR